MVTLTELLRRADAHMNATGRWFGTYRKSYFSPRSRTAGLAEMIRGSGRKPRTAVQRAQAQLSHKERLSAEHQLALEAAPAWDPRSLDRSKYFPHSSDRELARGARRAKLVELKEAA